MPGWDDFDTIAMLEAWEQLPSATAFLRDTFFSNVRTFETEAVQVDLYVGKRRLAPFVARYQGGRALPIEPFVSAMHIPPKFAPERVLPAEDLLYRGMGETIYSQRSPSERAAIILQRDMRDCDESITRREEWLCAQCLLKRRIELIGDGGGRFDIIYDTEPHNPNTPVPWSNTSLANPLHDLAQAQAAVRRRSGLNADIAIMAPDVANYFLSNLNVQGIMNLRNMQVGTVEPRIQSEQVDFICRLTYPSLEIYTYDEYYLDYRMLGTPPELTDVDASYMPSGQVLLGPSDSPGFMIYGGIVQYETPIGSQAVTYARERVPLLFTDLDSQLRKFRFTSRPLPQPVNTKGFFAFNVLDKGDPLAEFPTYSDIQPLLASAMAAKVEGPQAQQQPQPAKGTQPQPPPSKK